MTKVLQASGYFTSLFSDFDFFQTFFAALLTQSIFGEDYNIQPADRQAGTSGHNISTQRFTGHK